MSNNRVQDQDDAPAGQRWLIYLILLVALVVAVAIGLLVQQNQRTRQTAEKAAELSAALEQDGLTAIRPAIAEAVFGTTGGIVCANADGAFIDVLGSNGAGGPGIRPTDVRVDVLDSARVVIGVYCPDRSDEFETFVATLNVDTGTTTTDQDN